MCPTVGDFVSFSRSRQSANIAIKSVRFDQDKSTIVVVPTMDTNGPLASTVNKLYDPIPVVFVESSGEYFNYSRSVNRGIRFALEHNPDWIIVSNDDMFRIDPSKKLLTGLECDKGHDYVMGVRVTNAGPSSGLTYIIPLSAISLPLLVQKSLKGRYALAAGLSSLRHLADNHAKYTLLDAGSLVRTPRSLVRRLVAAAVSFHYPPFYNVFDFAAFRSATLRLERFDETYINGFEDFDMSIRLAMHYSVGLVDFRIGSLPHTSLGRSSPLSSLDLRGTYNLAYLNTKLFSDTKGPGSVADFDPWQIPS